MHPKFGRVDGISFDSSDNCHFKIDCESEGERQNRASMIMSPHYHAGTVKMTNSLCHMFSIRHSALIWFLICEHDSEVIILMQLSNWETQFIILALQQYSWQRQTYGAADGLSPSSHRAFLKRALTLKTRNSFKLEIKRFGKSKWFIIISECWSCLQALNSFIFATVENKIGSLFVALYSQICLMVPRRNWPKIEPIRGLNH